VVGGALIVLVLLLLLVLAPVKRGREEGNGKETEYGKENE
jgi:hypothetical protein